MAKYRAIKNKKHRIAKAIRRVRRTGDDWAESTNKQYLEADRQKAKTEVKEQMRDTVNSNNKAW